MSYRAAVITVSDKGFRGERVDTSGPALCAMLKELDCTVEYTAIVPDEPDLIQKELLACADTRRISLLLTTGGTGLSPRDVTPEATLAVLDREARGIAEAMRNESMRITPRGCLSRGVAGIRGSCLIVNLPGSEKAATENLRAVLPALDHALAMLTSKGSADCAAPMRAQVPPSLDLWLREAAMAPNAEKVGMYLIHQGVVRATPRAQVRGNQAPGRTVCDMAFSYDPALVEKAVERAYAMEGIYYVRAWLNQGTLPVGAPLMLLLVGGDIRPNVTNALQTLTQEIKTQCVTEQECFDE